MRNWRFFFEPIYILSAVALIIVAGSLWYSNSLVRELAQKEERLVSFWADAYEFIAKNDNLETTFLIDNLILKKLIPVPAIVVDAKGKPIMNNLRISRTLPEAEQNKILQEELIKMKDRNFTPIPIEYLPGNFHFVVYRETDELRRLRYYPYVTLLVLLGFIGVVFVNFYVAQKSQQNKVWVGLSKETAHQLGTPISGLIAWVELLRTNIRDDNDQMIADELEKDIKHLEIIANRFSKIGSDPELTPYPIAETLEHAVAYVRRRASRSGQVTIEFFNELPDGFLTLLSPTLFEWVVENLVKNAMDAMAGRKGGYIYLRAGVKNDQLIIEVEDNGKGVAPGDVKKIFNPGFTTKRRGWGLGLSLSKRIIENFHKGKIFVKKTEIDKGTTFRIILPLKKKRANLFYFWTNGGRA